ncbi:hypothetical protein ACHAXT_000606 [Thalassiosira profunda]
MTDAQHPPSTIRVKTPDRAMPREQSQPRPPPPSRSRGSHPRSRSREAGQRLAARRKSLSGGGTGAMRPSKSYSEIRAAYNIGAHGDALPSRGFHRSYDELLDGRETAPGQGQFHRSYDELLAPHRPYMRGNSDGSSVNATGAQRHDTSTIATNYNSNMAGMKARDAANRRRKAFNEMVVPVEGYVSDTSGNVRNNNFRGRRRGTISDGGYNSGNDVRNRRRGTIGDGGYVSSGSELASNNTNPNQPRNGFRRRITHDGSFALGLSGKRYPNSTGNFARAFTSQRRGSVSGSDVSGDVAGERNRPSMSSAPGNLRPLPEGKSLRCSVPTVPVDLDDANANEFMTKNLDEMTLEELQAELKTHGIAVQGMFDRGDLVGVCMQARKRRMANMYRPVSRNNSNEDLKNQGQSQQSPPRRPSYQPQRKRRTSDSRDSAGFSANPQQGKQRVSTTARRGSDNVGSGRHSRRSSRSSLSSLGDGLEQEMNEMTVLNAPLGVGLSGIGYDVENPHQQMGLLMQQMQALEDQMNDPQDTAPPKNMPRRMSGHQLATGAANLSRNNSRRLSIGSGRSGASSGGLLSSGQSAPRRMSFGSHHSRGSWYIGSDPSGRSGAASARGRSGPPTRNSSYASLELLASDTAGHVKDPSRRGTSSSGGAPSESNIDWAPAAAEPAAGATNSDDKTDAMSVMSDLTGKHGSDAKKPLLSKKAKIAGALLLAVACVVIAVCVALFAFNDEGKESVTSRSQLLEYPEAPPSDIEGRCSPSNLPGSLSACLSACLPSSCCYPNYSEEPTCISETDQRSVDACDQYRPYCDVFYDPWPGATEGVLRSPPENLVRMCLETVGQPGDDDNNLLGDAMKSSERKRLRQHVAQGERILTTPDQICSRYCVASRCCHASADTDGLVLSASGVFTDVMSGDHVMTNCQADFGKNKPMCEEYDDHHWCWLSNGMDEPANIIYRHTHCIDKPIATHILIAAIGRPISDPSLLNTHIFTQSNFFKLTNRADSIANFSHGTRAGEHAGDRRGNGLCCYSEVLGYGMPSCYLGNEAVCLEYYPCLALAPGSFLLPPPAPSAVGNTEDSTTTPATATSEATDALPTPAQNLAAICSQSSLATNEGLGKCISACQPASCCDVQVLGSSSCYFDNKEICDEYSPCINLNGPSATEPPELPPEVPLAQEVPQDDTATEEQLLPPEALASLATACSYDFLVADSGSLCFGLCALGSCCADGSCLENDANASQSMIDAICETYSPCNNLWLQSPPSNLGELCNENSKPAADECATICSAVSCCFSDDTSDSDAEALPACDVQFEESCAEYAPYCAPDLPPTEAVAPVDLPPTPPDLAALCSFSPEFCKTACQAAQCCFESSEDVPSCFAANEKRCEEYAPCAAFDEQGT